MTKISLETSRLLLRPFLMKDAKEYFTLTRDEFIKKYVPGASPDTLQEIEELFSTYYLNGDFIHDFYFIIENKKTHDIVGAIHITENFSRKDFSCAYFIGAKYRKQGYMKEALTDLFETIIFTKPVFFVIEPENIPSQNLIHQIRGVHEYTEKNPYVYVKD